MNIKKCMKNIIAFLLLTHYFACTDNSKKVQFTLENPNLVSKQDIKSPFKSQGTLILDNEEGEYFEGLFVRNPQHAYYVVIEKSLLRKNNFVVNCCKDSDNSHIADTLKNVRVEIIEQNKFSLSYKNIGIYEIADIVKSN